MCIGNELRSGFRMDGSSLRAAPAKPTPEGEAWSTHLLKLHRPGRKPSVFLERMRTGGFALYPIVEKVDEDNFLKISMAAIPSELETIDCQAGRRPNRRFIA